MYALEFHCPECHNAWSYVDEEQFDDDCPECGLTGITPIVETLHSPVFCCEVCNVQWSWDEFDVAIAQREAVAECPKCGALGEELPQ